MKKRRRYFEQIKINDKVENREKILDSLHEQEFDVVSLSPGGRKRFDKNKKKIKITAQREIDIFDLKQKVKNGNEKNDKSNK